MILYNSEESAKQETITGWVSSNGYFYGKDENLARYDGCTHKICSCGNTMDKMYLKCDICREKINQEKYLQLEFREWDCEIPVYSKLTNEYYFDCDEINDLLSDSCIDPKDLMLVLCEPNYHRELTSEYFYDVQFDGEIPSILEDKISEFNIFLETLGVHSWSPSKIRTEFCL